MTQRNTHTPILAIALAAILATPALGQDVSTRKPSASLDASGSRAHVRPAGWVRIGYDIDQDGRFEAVEYIYAFDLDQARERSRQRDEARRPGNRQDARAEGAAMDRPRTQRAPEPQQRDRMRAMRDRERRDMDRALRAQAWREHMRRQRAGAQERPQARRENDAIRRAAPIPGDALRRVNGQILQTHTQRLVGSQQDHLLAKLRTREGRIARVDLGPKNQLKDLDFAKGDAIAAVGTVGTINNMPVLLAHRLRSAGQEILVNRQNDFNLRRMRGTIDALRTATVHGTDTRHTLARVNLVSGSSAKIALGSEEKLKPLNLEPGDKISLLVRTGKINDQPALFAEQVRSNGKTVTGLHSASASHRTNQAAKDQPRTLPAPASKRENAAPSPGQSPGANGAKAQGKDKTPSPASAQQQTNSGTEDPQAQPETDTPRGRESAEGQQARNQPAQK